MCEIGVAAAPVPSLYPAIRQSNVSDGEAGDFGNEMNISYGNNTGLIIGDGIILTLPKWDKKYSYCGEWSWAESCENFCKPEAHKVYCDRPECPVCYEHWAGREAGRCSERLMGCESAYEREGKEIGDCKSVIWSPPQEWAKDLLEKKGYKGLNEIYKELYKVMRWAGVKGGVVIDHPFRAHSITECRLQDWDISFHFHVLYPHQLA